jgi:hypothetical protein
MLIKVLTPHPSRIVKRGPDRRRVMRSQEEIEDEVKRELGKPVLSVRHIEEVEDDFDRGYLTGLLYALNREDI